MQENSTTTEVGAVPIRNRISSAITLALAFYLLFWLISIVLSRIPVVSQLWGAFNFFGSPVMWALTITGYLGPPSAKDGALISLSMWTTYPLAGFIIGLIWPIQLAANWRTLRAIAIRFAWTLLALVGFAFVVGIVMSGVKSL